ncbi:IS4 family transposase, partial [Streptococcus sp. 10F2]
MPNQVRKQLRNSITAVIERDKRSLLHNPSDFTRKRELSLDKTVNLILGMSGKSISKELLDADIWITESAFVQARYKIKSST